MEFIVTFLLFLPLIALLWLANVADKRRMMTPPQRDVGALVYVLLAAMWIGILAAGVITAMMGVAYRRYADIAAMATLYQAQGVDPDVMVSIMHALPRLGLGVAIIALAGLSALLPPVRRLAARIIAISPDRVVHAVALSYSVLIFINLWLVLGLGLETLLDMMEAEASADASSAFQLMSFLWGQNIALALMALVGVGWLSRRGWRSALQRLGLTRPDLSDVAWGVGMGVGMFILLIPVGLIMELLGLGTDMDEIEQLIEAMMGPMLTSLPGILTLGLAAALGEELVFRGALQPRFGIALTAILFAFTHSQYVISPATLVVFILGLVLGWVRMRRNTSTAMILHATYNITIGLIGLLAVQMMK